MKHIRINNHPLNQHHQWINYMYRQPTKSHRTKSIDLYAISPIDQINHNKRFNYAPPFTATYFILSNFTTIEQIPYQTRYLLYSINYIPVQFPNNTVIAINLNSLKDLLTTLNTSPPNYKPTPITPPYQELSNPSTQTHLTLDDDLLLKINEALNDPLNYDLHWS